MYITATPPSFSPEDLVRLKNMIPRLEHESVCTKVAGGESIVFYNLGFKYKLEFKTWLESNAPKDQYGYGAHLSEYFRYGFSLKLGIVVQANAMNYL